MATQRKHHSKPRAAVRTARDQEPGMRALQSPAAWPWASASLPLGLSHLRADPGRPQAQSSHPV